MMEIVIRQYRTDDAPALTQIFYNAVHTLAGDCYSEAEVRAWAPLPIDYDSWRTRLERHQPWVAEVDGSPVGFISLLSQGEIGLAYVHSAFQGQGIASRLYSRLEQAALRTGVHSLHVDASHAARPLFERLGFTVVRRNLVERQACRLVNWRMHKTITTT